MEDGVLAKAHAMLAQGAAGLLIQFLDLGGNHTAIQDAQAFGKAEGKALGQALQGFVAAHGQKRLELGGDLAVNEMLQAAADLFGHLFPRFLIDKGLDRGLGDLTALDQLTDGRGAPHQAPLFGKVHLCIGGVVELVRPQMELWAQRLHRRCPQNPRLIGAGRCILRETEPLKTAGEFAFNRHFAFVIHLGHEGLLLLQPPHQNTGAAIYKSLGQGCMQRI